MTSATQAIETYDNLNLALRGEVLVNIGQVGPFTKKALKQAVRAGKLVEWRGYWFPHAGAPVGIGPLKTCWSTPETAAYFVEMKRGLKARNAA